jgi:NAD(P)H-dependent nitrite reductase small subunit
VKRICKLSDLTPGAGTFVAAGDVELAVFLIGEDVFAIENGCPHMGGNLAAGQVHRGVVSCPLHHWLFDVRTGVCPESPDVAVDAYRCEIRGGEVYAEI